MDSAWFWSSADSDADTKLGSLLFSFDICAAPHQHSSKHSKELIICSMDFGSIHCRGGAQRSPEPWFKIASISSVAIIVPTTPRNAAAERGHSHGI